MPRKQTSPEISTLAGKMMNGKRPTREEELRLAASALSQDETPGQAPRPRSTKALNPRATKAKPATKASKPARPRKK